MPVEGVDLIAKNIVKFTAGFVNSVNRTMKEVESMLDQEVTRNMSLSDHSTKDLVKLDHPYAARHGSEGLPIHSPQWAVHTQSGQLLSSKSSGTENASIEEGNLKSSAFVKVDPGIAEHALYVIYGTSKMIPRPFLSLSRDIVAPDAKAYIREKLKFLKVQ